MLRIWVSTFNSFKKMGYAIDRYDYARVWGI